MVTAAQNCFFLWVLSWRKKSRRHYLRVFSDPLQQVEQTYVVWRGRKLIYFGGCDYLRLSVHPQVQKAVVGGLARFGLNVAASRQTTGNHRLYERVEAATAEYFGSEAALFVSNGYLTNLVVGQGIGGMADIVFVDEKAHPSLLDGLKFLALEVISFRHLNAADLRRQFRAKGRKKRAAVLTDGMFPQDGAVAPLAEYRAAVGEDPLLWVDDSHAAGILGERGRGSPEFAGMGRNRLIQTITFSKAFGVYGGAVLCSEEQRAKLARSSRIVAASTPLPLPLVNGVLAALRITRGSMLRTRLWTNVEYFCEQLQTTNRPSPVFAIYPPSQQSCQALAERLLEAGIFPSVIEYPGSSRFFRFALSARHSRPQLSSLANVLRHVR